MPQPILPLLLVAACTLCGAEADAFPFARVLRGAPGGIDVGAILDEGAAGAHGRVLVRDGHFILADRPDRPFRLFGINLTEGRCLPPSDQADAIATHLAAMGFNAVRLHFIETALLEPDARRSTELSPKRLDRLDAFVAALKRHGLYINLNLLSGRWRYRADDGVAEREAIAGIKFVNFFDPVLIALQKDVARQLLDRRNPYTGLRYAEDPVLAQVELINEASLFGYGETGGGARLPPYYASQLDAAFNRWLGERYGDDAALATAWGRLESGESLALGTIGRRPIPGRRQLDTDLFHVGIEQAYYRDMGAYVRSLGFAGPVSGNNNWYGPMPLLAQAETDCMDMHAYFWHPRIRTGEKDAAGYPAFSMVMAHAVNHPEGFTPDLPLSWPNILPMFKWPMGALAGKPLMCSELNAPFPQSSMHEAPVLCGAYASLQDLGALYLFAYNEVVEGDKRPFFFDLSASLWTQVPTMALAFRRGDVAPANQELLVAVSPSELSAAQTASGRAYGYAATPALPLEAALRHRVRQVFAEHPGQPSWRSTEPLEGNPHRSDTGELTWDHGGHRDGLMTVDAPRFQALVRAGDAPRSTSLSCLAADTAQPCAVSAISLDGRPLAAARRILVTVAGGMRYAGQAWTPQGNGLSSWGTPPALLDRVRARIALARDPAGAAVHPLAADGTRLPPLPLAAGPALSFATGGEPVTWYLATWD